MEVKGLTGNRVSLFSSLIVYLIIFYQKVISPVKGFSCAHRYQHGGSSCSE
jgi:putative component of membrane protein insertase Oxa1/YidC/SpoIIIJ protein YidD